VFPLTEYKTAALNLLFKKPLNSISIVLGLRKQFFGSTRFQKNGCLHFLGFKKQFASGFCLKKPLEKPRTHVYPRFQEIVHPISGKEAYFF
jgi:hypothetical protein